MKKTLIGLAAAAAIAAPIAVAGSANAADATQTVTFHATQPSGGGGNWNHTFTVQAAANGSFTGTNKIVGLDAGEIVTVDETVTGQFTDVDHDGIYEVSLASHRDTGFYTFDWSVINAPMDGKVDSMTDGTTTYASAVNWGGGPLPITFTAPEGYSPTAADPVVPVGKANHGTCVSGATAAGIKGNALAAIAKDNSKVGNYGSVSCPKV
jgi:hypothetical protein